MLQLNILTAEDRKSVAAVENRYRWSISALHKVNVHRESICLKLHSSFWFDIILGLGLLLLLRNYIRDIIEQCREDNTKLFAFSRFHSQGWKSSTLPTTQHRTTGTTSATTPLATISWSLRNTENYGSSRMWWHAWSFLSPFPWSSWPSIIFFLWYVH